MGNCKLFTLNKRHNSTLQPTGTGTDTSVILKGGSNMLSPVFTMHHNTFPTYNYVKYNSRYYFVTGIKAVHDDLFEISCEVDVLATFKASIQAISAYVLYYNHQNLEIADKRLSLKASKTKSDKSGTFGFLGTSHCYILTVIGENNVNAYCLNQAQIESLYSGTFETHYDNAIDALPAVTGTGFADTMISFAQWYAAYLKSTAGCFNYAGTISDNIKSCIILPVTSGSVGGTPNTPVYIGAIDTGITGFKINNRVMTDYATVDIPWQNTTDWRRLAPYHEIFLYIPALGLISLSPSDLIGAQSLRIDMTMDVLSGDAIFVVKADNDNVVYYASTNLATPYAIGSSQVSPSQITNALIGAAGALTGNPTIAAAGLLGLANDIQPNPICIGSNSGGAILGIHADTVKCYTIFHDTAVAIHDQAAISGEPFNGVMSLSGVSGFVQTKDASVAGGGVGEPAMTDTERQNINRLLDGGIYIE